MNVCGYFYKWFSQIETNSFRISAGIFVSICDIFSILQNPVGYRNDFEVKVAGNVYAHEAITKDLCLSVFLWGVFTKNQGG